MRWSKGANGGGLESEEREESEEKRNDTQSFINHLSKPFNLMEPVKSSSAKTDNHHFYKILVVFLLCIPGHKNKNLCLFFVYFDL